MKKVLTILMVLALVAGFAFATEGTVNTGDQKLTVTSSVGIVYPQFKLTGTYSGTPYNATATSEALAGTPIAALSIAENTIVIDCTIAQNGGKKKTDATVVADHARYKGVATFTITVGDLTEKNPGQGNTAAKVAGHIIDLASAAKETYKGHNGTGTDVTATAGKDLTNAITNEVVGTDGLKATYNGKVVNQNIGTFKAVWYQDDSVPTGEYQADITVTISAT